MKNRILGIIGIAGSPFLLLDIIINGGSGGDNYNHTSLSGLFSFIYISSWMCSIIGLRNIQATGSGKWGRSILNVQLLCLAMANCWNIYEIISPGANTTIYFILDKFWPLSNLIMFVTGIAILRSNRLDGWKRYIPLITGLWLPLAIGLTVVIGRNKVSMLLPAAYSVVAWALLGIVVSTSTEKCFWIRSRLCMKKAYLKM